jgi:hypothetical protein
MTHVCLWSTLTSLKMHHLPVSAVLHILSDRTLYLLDLRLMVRASYTRFLDLLLQCLQPLRKILNVPFARTSLQWLPAERAVQSASRAVRACSSPRLVRRIASNLLPPAFVTRP